MTKNQARVASNILKELDKYEELNERFQQSVNIKMEVTFFYSETKAIQAFFPEDEFLTLEFSNAMHKHIIDKINALNAELEKL